MRVSSDWRLSWENRWWRCEQRAAAASFAALFIPLQSPQFSFSFQEERGACGRVGSAINAGCQKENAGVYVVPLNHWVKAFFSSSLLLSGQFFQEINNKKKRSEGRGRIDLRIRGQHSSFLSILSSVKTWECIFLCGLFWLKQRSNVKQFHGIQVTGEIIQFPIFSIVFLRLISTSWHHFVTAQRSLWPSVTWFIVYWSAAISMEIPAFSCET